MSVSDTPHRPPGKVWLHLSPLLQADVAAELCDAILDRNADLEIVASARIGLPDMPELADSIALPGPGRAAISAFLDSLRPSVVCWTDGHLDSGILRELDHRDIPVHLIDCGDAIEASRISFSNRIFRSSPLRHFTTITVGDMATRSAMLRAGAREAQVGIRGILERTPPPVSCRPEQRDHLASLLVARPIWLAAGVNAEEVDAVLASARQLLRRSHRQLLVLSPARPSDADLFCNRMEAAGLAYRRRSEGAEPDNQTQVLLADEPGEMGLWYRLATVTFIGRTLAGPTAGMVDPFAPAMLGSVVLHGPAVHPQYSNFTRLARARASGQVAHAGELSLALESLLAPDRAALMAHAAWEISTSGSDAIAYAADTIVASAERRGLR